ncbi:hypothetical protein DV738_g1236, partial [Chaetothyriales sp. CBS 135597]
MAPQAYFHIVSTPSAYNREHKPEGVWLECLDKLSASRWGRVQLVALRVLVVDTGANILPFFGEDEDFLPTSSNLRFDSYSHPSESGFWQLKEDRESIQALFDLVKGPAADDKVTQIVRAEYALNHAYGRSLAVIWAAMNRLCLLSQTNDSLTAADDDNEDDIGGGAISSPTSSPLRGGMDLKLGPSLALTDEQRPKRQANQPSASSYNREELAAIIGASSPPDEPPTSSQQFIPEEEAASSPNWSEDLTHRFVSEFIRHVLLHLPQEQWSNDDVIDFDDHKLSLCCRIGQTAYNSIDDGGLYLVKDCVDRIGRVAILETKRALGTIVDGKPVLSDERFAQMIGQALSIRKQASQVWAWPKDTIFIIVAARYYIRFLEVHITDEYIDQLEVRQEHEQPAAEFIRVKATKWFDLREKRSRRYAIVNIAGIVKHALPRYR